MATDDPLIDEADESSGDLEPVGIASRFRGFLPVALDVETGGFNANTDALLEIAAVIIEMTPFGELRAGPNFRYHVQPFHGSRIDPASLAVNGIDPHHPLRPSRRTSIRTARARSSSNAACRACRRCARPAILAPRRTDLPLARGSAKSANRT